MILNGQREYLIRSQDDFDNSNLGHFFTASLM